VHSRIRGRNLVHRRIGRRTLSRRWPSCWRASGSSASPCGCRSGGCGPARSPCCAGRRAGVSSGRSSSTARASPRGGWLPPSRPAGTGGPGRCAPRSRSTPPSRPSSPPGSPRCSLGSTAATPSRSRLPRPVSRSPTTCPGWPRCATSPALGHGSGSTPTAGGAWPTRSTPCERSRHTGSSMPSSRWRRSPTCARCGAAWHARESTCRSRPTSRSARPRTLCWWLARRRPTSSSSRRRRSGGSGARCRSSPTAGCRPSCPRLSTRRWAWRREWRWRRPSVELLTGDVTADSLVPRAGVVRTRSTSPDERLLARWRAPSDREAWWRQRVADCHAVLRAG
jgi:hypothetical protein